MDAVLPKDITLFISDSLIQSLPVSAVVSPSVNYGIGTDTTSGVLQRLLTYGSLHRASAVVLHIGWNDLRYRNDQNIIQNIKKITSRIPENVPIVLSAILRADTEYHPAYKILNKRVKHINTELEKWAETEDRIFFVNANSSLSDREGELNTLYHVGDGIHLNAEGNAHFVKNLKKGLKEALAWKKAKND